LEVNTEIIFHSSISIYHLPSAFSHFSRSMAAYFAETLGLKGQMGNEK